MSDNRRRRTWKPEEKLRIVLAGMEPGTTISELCRREGIQPTQYHTWKNQLTGSAEAVFGDKKSKAQEQKEARHADELRKKNAVIAEITAENLTLKKTLSD